MEKRIKSVFIFFLSCSPFSPFHLFKLSPDLFGLGKIRKQWTIEGLFWRMEITNEGKAVQRLGISKEQRLVIEIRLAYVQQKVPACMYRRYYLPR